MNTNGNQFIYAISDTEQVLLRLKFRSCSNCFFVSSEVIFVIVPIGARAAAKASQLFALYNIPLMAVPLSIGMAFLKSFRETNAHRRSSAA